MIRLMELVRDSSGIITGRIECDDGRVVDVEFAITSDDCDHFVVASEPYVFGDGYVRFPAESQVIAQAVHAFAEASRTDLSPDHYSNRRDVIL